MGKDRQRICRSSSGVLGHEVQTLGPTDIENYTPTERALIVAYGKYPNFAEALNEIVLPSFDAMAEIRRGGAVQLLLPRQHELRRAPPLAPTLAKLQLVAETTSWHDLHGTRVKTVFTGNAAPPPMDMYSWARIVTNTTLVNECKARLERSHKYIVDGLAKQQNCRWARRRPPKSAEGLATPRVLWLLRDTDRNIINQDDVVAMREAARVGHHASKSAHVPLQTLVSDFQNHEIVFAVHGADMANTVRAGDRSQAAGDGAADAVWLAGRGATITLVGSLPPRTASTGRALFPGPRTCTEQPYIEAYADGTSALATASTSATTSRFQRATA